jgi:predicted dehydrogenase
VSYQQDTLALYKRQVEAFNEAIQRDTEPLASGLDGLRVVQATVAMVESASTGRAVKIESLSVE